jgi:hypothetical protein
MSQTLQPTAELLSLLLEAARLAPSADNGQPFTLTPHTEGLILRADLSRVGGFSDKSGFLTFSALGAVAENLLQQSEYMGLKTEVVFADTDASTLYPDIYIKLFETAKLDVSKGLLPVIEQRYTERCANYLPLDTALDEQEYCSLLEPLACKVRIFSRENRADKKQLSKLAARAEALRFTSKDIHHELISAVDFENTHQGKQGLPLASLKLDPGAKVVLKAIRSWSLLSALNHLGFNQLLGILGAGQPLRQAPCVLVIGADSYQPKALFNSGRALHRVWLKITELGFIAQPYAAIGTMSSGHFEFVGAAEQQRLRVMSGSKYLSGLSAPMYVLRVGKAPKNLNKARTRRRDLAEFLQGPAERS